MLGFAKAAYSIVKPGYAKAKHEGPYTVYGPYFMVRRMCMKVNISKAAIEGKEEPTVELEDHDFWSLDFTLALIILPALKEFARELNGTPAVSNEDAPEDLRSDDDYSIERWEHVLNEMIFSFGAIVNEEKYTHDEESEVRYRNGLRLFGKYYGCLWT